jgi:hypothetical protein
LQRPGPPPHDLLAAAARACSTDGTSIASSPTSTCPGTAAHTSAGTAHGSCRARSNNTRRRAAVAWSCNRPGTAASASGAARGGSRPTQATCRAAGLCKRRNRSQSQSDSQCHVNDRAHFLTSLPAGVTPGSAANGGMGEEVAGSACRWPQATHDIYDSSASFSSASFVVLGLRYRMLILLIFCREMSIHLQLSSDVARFGRTNRRSSFCTSFV